MKKLINDDSCDILVIGAGITGLLAAYKLKSQGFDVLVVEKHCVGGKSTLKSTGLIQYSSDVMLHKLMADDVIDGVKFYKDSLAAVDEIEEISKHFKNKKVFRRCPSLYLASTHEDIPTLKKEYDALTHHGFLVEELTQEEIQGQYGINKPYGIVTEGDASIYPYFYTQELAGYFQEIGGRLCQGFFLNAKDGFAYFKGNHIVNYKYIVYALGYETVNYKPVEGLIKRASFAFFCNPEIKTKEIMVWETARPYLYQNTLEPGKVVVGGGDDPLKKVDPENIYLPIKKLKKNYMAWYGLQSLELEGYYFGEFFSFVDGLPKYHKEGNHIYLYPYGGNGVIYSLYLVNQILDEVFN